MIKERRKEEINFALYPKRASGRSYRTRTSFWSDDGKNTVRKRRRWIRQSKNPFHRISSVLSGQPQIPKKAEINYDAPPHKLPFTNTQSFMTSVAATARLQRQLSVTILGLIRSPKKQFFFFTHACKTLVHAPFTGSENGLFPHQCAK